MHRIDEERSAGIPEGTTHNHVDDYASGPGEEKAYPEMRAAKYSDYQDENHSWRKFGRNQKDKSRSLHPPVNPYCVL